MNSSTKIDLKTFLKPPILEETSLEIPIISKLPWPHIFLAFMCSIIGLNLLNFIMIASTIKNNTAYSFVKKDKTKIYLNGQILTMNLTVADLLVGIISFIAISYYYGIIQWVSDDESWQFQQIFYCKKHFDMQSQRKNLFLVFYNNLSPCKILLCSAGLAVINSFISILFLAIDRFAAIVFSIKYQNILEKISVGWILLIIWILSIVTTFILGQFVTTPDLIGRFIERDIDFFTSSSEKCDVTWLKNYQKLLDNYNFTSENTIRCSFDCSFYLRPEFLLITVLFFILPLLGVIVALYGKIYLISQSHIQNQLAIEKMRLNLIKTSCLLDFRIHCLYEDQQILNQNGSGGTSASAIGGRTGTGPSFTTSNGTSIALLNKIRLESLTPDHLIDSGNETDQDRNFLEDEKLRKLLEDADTGLVEPPIINKIEDDSPCKPCYGPCTYLSPYKTYNFNNNTQQRRDSLTLDSEYEGPTAHSRKTSLESSISVNKRNALSIRQEHFSKHFNSPAILSPIKFLKEKTMTCNMSETLQTLPSIPSGIIKRMKINKRLSSTYTNGTVMTEATQDSNEVTQNDSVFDDLYELERHEDNKKRERIDSNHIIRSLSHKEKARQIRKPVFRQRLTMLTHQSVDEEIKKYKSRTSVIKNEGELNENSLIFPSSLRTSANKVKAENVLSVLSSAKLNIRKDVSCSKNTSVKNDSFTNLGVPNNHIVRVPSYRTVNRMASGINPSTLPGNLTIVQMTPKISKPKMNRPNLIRKNQSNISMASLRSDLSSHTGKVESSHVKSMKNILTKYLKEQRELNNNNNYKSKGKSLQNLISLASPRISRTVDPTWNNRSSYPDEVEDEIGSPNKRHSKLDKRKGLSQPFIPHRPSTPTITAQNSEATMMQTNLSLEEIVPIPSVSVSRSLSINRQANGNIAINVTNQKIQNNPQSPRKIYVRNENNHSSEDQINNRASVRAHSNPHFYRKKHSISGRISLDRVSQRSENCENRVSLDHSVQLLKKIRSMQRQERRLRLHKIKPLMTLSILVGSILFTWIPVSVLILSKILSYEDIRSFAAKPVKTEKNPLSLRTVPVISRLGEIENLYETCQNNQNDSLLGQLILFIIIANSWKNPIIYSFTNKTFKNKIWNLFMKNFGVVRRFFSGEKICLKRKKRETDLAAKGDYKEDNSRKERRSSRVFSDYYQESLVDVPVN